MDAKTPQDLICQVEGHQNNQLIPYICVSKKCDKKSRYLCQDCLIDGTHSHNGQKPELFTKEKLSAQFNQNLGQLKQSNTQKQQEIEQQNQQNQIIVNEIEGFLQELKFILQQNCQFSDSDENYFQELNAQITEKFFQLAPDTLHRIFNILEYKSQAKEQLRVMCQEFRQKIKMINSKIESLNLSCDLDNQQMNIDEEIKKLKFTVSLIEPITKNGNYGEFAHLLISPNNQYLVTVLMHQHKKKYHIHSLNVFDLESNKKNIIKIKEQAVDDHIFLQFSVDSQQLFYQQLNEPLFAYQCQNEKIIEYKYFPDLFNVKDIVSIEQNKALVINKQSQILLLNMEFQYRIFCIKVVNLDEVVYDQSHNILICQAYRSLVFYDAENGNKINESCLNIQLECLEVSNDGSKLFAFYEQQFFIFQLNYNQKLVDVKLLQKIALQKHIVSYSLVWSQQYIVIFEENGVIGFYDQKLRLIKQFCVGFDALQSDEIDGGQCSDDLTAITVTSIQNNKGQRLILDDQK